MSEVINTMAMERNTVTRSAIKLRRAIHRDYCSCWGKSIVVDGVPYYLCIDNISTEELENFLDYTDKCVSLYTKEPLEHSKCKIEMALSRGLPVVINTSEAVPESIIDSMQKIAHCAIHFHLDYTDKHIEESIQCMMSHAKTFKVAVVLESEYIPHLMKKLDLFEVIEDCKNYISHVMLRFPIISDLELHKHIDDWDLDKFKASYQPEVMDRKWKIKHRVRHEFITALELFSRYKNISLEVIESCEYLSDRTKYDTSGLSALPTGMRQFSYSKVDDVFCESPISSFICPKCGKSLFI